MPYSHVESRGLFVPFAPNPALDVWTTCYCRGNVHECARSVRSGCGPRLSPALRPDQKSLSTKPPRNDLGTVALFNAVVKHLTTMTGSTGLRPYGRTAAGPRCQRDGTDFYRATAYEFAVRSDQASGAVMLNPKSSGFSAGRVP